MNWMQKLETKGLSKEEIKAKIRERYRGAETVFGILLATFGILMASWFLYEFVILTINDREFCRIFSQKDSMHLLTKNAINAIINQIY